MKELSAKDVDRLLAADPASDVTESELERSRARSLSFQDSDLTHIFAGGSGIGRQRRAVRRRRWVGGIVVAAAVVGATVLVPAILQSPPSTPPAAIELPAGTGTGAATPTPTAAQLPPAGPFHDMFVSADEVLVVEALPTGSMQQLGIEPVNVRQVLKGSSAVGTTSVDVSAADDRISGTLLWRDSQKEAPMTFLGFFARGGDGGLQLMNTAHSLLRVQNIRTSTTVNPVTDEPVDIGDDLRARINVAPMGDVPVSTYEGNRSGGVAPDVVKGTEGTGGSREGVVRGHMSVAGACFTFENSAEKVYLRWPTGFTAAIRSLPVDAEGRVYANGAVQADTPVILNEWGFIYMTDLEPRPQVSGELTTETASCAGETLRVFEVTPELPGASPFQKQHGVALPRP